MSHDPFDQLRNANPLPDETLPAAPMGTADRIMRRGPGSARWPGWVTASAAAVAVLLVGGGWMLWLGRGDTSVEAAVPTTSVAAGSTTTPATVMPVISTTAYLLTESPTGPVLVPVPRAVPSGDQVSASFDALLSGPTTGEETADLFSRLPQSDWLDLVDTIDGTAIVRVSDELVAARYEALPAEALAQIVFTLTSIDGADAVEFLLGSGEGVRAGVVPGSLQLVPEDEFADHESVHFPATRLTFEAYMPLAFIETPSYGAEIQLPTTATGTAISIGDEIRLTLSAPDESILWQETVTAVCGTPWSECRQQWDRGAWGTTIPDTGYVGSAVLIAEVFGSGVEILDSRSYPLLVASSDGSVATTTTIIDAGPAVPGELAVYMLMESDATHLDPDLKLVPASWPTAILSAPLTDAPRQAMQWLVQGPLPGWTEANPALSTSIPVGTRLLDLEVANGVATVDLSSEFITGGGTLSFEARLAQVVFTLTRFEDIDGVRFLIEGTPTTVFGNDGVIVDDVINRDRFEDLLPPIMIETPLYWGSETGNPLVVSGTANVFEATVSLAFTNNEGLILWEGITTATCGTGCRGEWSIEIPYEVAADQLGAIIAWEESARDGSQTNVREHPVWLRGSSDIPVCSGQRVPADLPDQPDLPEPVAALRVSIFQAARNCDWDELSGLIGPNTATSFGGPEDPIARWQEEETAGLEPMYWLASTLRLPSLQERIEVVDGPWIWPSAAAYYWENVPKEDRDALLEIYREDDLGAFEDFGGFFMYRVGISPAGEWTFFVVGD